MMFSARERKDPDIRMIHDNSENGQTANPTACCIINERNILTDPTDFVQRKSLSVVPTTDCVLEEPPPTVIITKCFQEKEAHAGNPREKLAKAEHSKTHNELHYFGNESPIIETFTESTVTAISSQRDGGDIYAVACRSESPIRMRLTKLEKRNYCVSPVHSDDIVELDDDSVEDPNYTASSCDGYSSESEDGNNVQTEIEEKTKGKKRKQNPENWAVQKAKTMRNSGKAYVSSSKTKKQFQARKVRPACGGNCRLRCREKINDEVRQEIFDSYWNVANLQRQREFIVSHTEPIKPKYRYSTTQELRSLNSAFYFEVNKTRIRVCKTFFKATIDINDRPIRTALTKKTETGFVEGDMRGKHDKHPTVDPEIKDSVRNFIIAIPRVESHYLRAQTTREFIESGKSLADLYRDYKESREKLCLPFANAVMFNRIFNGEYNISFYVPKKDQCDLCESFKNADEECKKTLVESYNQHQEEKVLSRKEKDVDKNKPNVAVYDLQAVMPLPKGMASSFYYKSKINCYNFTVSDLYAKHAECFFWTETEGRRGAVEIGSCILHFIELLVEKAGKSDDIELILYSDNCCGQQKNKYLLAVYWYAVHKHNLRSITHKFLIQGHSQNEGDNVHSVIEKQVKRHVKSSPIYVPEQYVTLISMAKKTGPPYRIHQLTYEDFYDVKALQEEWGTNFNVDTDKKKLKWHDIKVLNVKKESPEAFFYKTSYKDMEFRKVNVQNMKIRSSRSWEAVRLVVNMHSMIFIIIMLCSIICFYNEYFRFQVG